MILIVLGFLYGTEVGAGLGVPWPREIGVLAVRHFSGFTVGSGVMGRRLGLNSSNFERLEPFFAKVTPKPKIVAKVMLST